ncbi:Stealth protein CR4, conserved region 4 [Lachnospiraceae bacterium NE2001]|nr:Stealth protein CR4, conserved region 4 [Lachnospiraceae bacterium NE2001]
MSNPIDFVITWVDGDDKEWLDLREKYKVSKDGDDNRKRRYRNWNNLKYVLRGIEENAPWFNHVYIVTPGQCPDWLDESCDKISIINQNDLLDDCFLPTFNNCAVELVLHKIPGLSENFVYINDDMFIIKNTEPEDFFIGNKPCDTVAFSPIQAVYSKDGKSVYGISVMNTRLVAKRFTKAEVMRNCKKKFFNLKNGKEIIKTISMIPYKGITGFNEMHTAYSYNKKTFYDVWMLAEEELKETCGNKFRGEFSLAHWCMRYWQICEGNFEVRNRNFSRFFDMYYKGDQLDVINCIRKKKNKMICINDNVENDEDFPIICNEINKALDNCFPKKSMFEL